MRLDKGQPVSLRDTPRVFDLAIDFSQPPEDIVDALRAVFQDGISSGRWARRHQGGDVRTTAPQRAT